MKCCVGGVLAAWGTVSRLRSAQARRSPALRNIAFFYGDTPDFSELGRYQFVVLEPDGGFSLPIGARTQWLAYVSVGEVTPLRDYYSHIPRAWIIGKNEEWRSELVDQGAPGWAEFFVERVVTPLWLRGYRGFFLDTLDSYQLFAKDDEERLRNQQGLVAVIHAISKHFPSAKIVLNRGFELLPQVHRQVYAVAFESLFAGWSEAHSAYVRVPEEDRAWLLGQADIAKREYGLPVIAIDYCAPGDDRCAHRIVHRIREKGLVPYVGDGHLQTLNLAALT